MAERVVTLPPGIRGEAAKTFASEAKRRGADLLELRTDLHAAEDFNVDQLAKDVPIIISERGKSLPETWQRAARWIDRPLSPNLDTTNLVSLHAHQPLSPEQAEAQWAAAPFRTGVRIKHVEPLGLPGEGWRLLETRRRLQHRFGTDSVTVLGTGPLALPFRAVLARENTLDYLALSPAFQAAPGQRLLDDAVREARRKSGSNPSRMAILGSNISNSRSPRIHRQPFDRIDVPADAPIAELLEALRAHYRGFAITSPFKKVLARHVGSSLDAINTLVRRGQRWESANTDVAGAAAVLKQLVAKRITVLGAGGAASAIMTASQILGLEVSTMRHAEISERPLEGTLLWTWPETIAPPANLRFQNARVAIIAYGAPARRLGVRIRGLGGTPLLVGPRWFVAQAREQRRFWDSVERA